MLCMCLHVPAQAVCWVPLTYLCAIADCIDFMLLWSSTHMRPQAVCWEAS